MNVSVVPDIDVSEGDPNADVKALARDLTKRSSIYMNPEIVAKLLQRMTGKDQILRNNRQKLITQQFLIKCIRVIKD